MKKIDLFGTELAIPHGDEQLISSLLNGMSNPSALPDILQVDSNGLITGFHPIENMTWGEIFFFQNLMVAQRLFLMDEFLKKHGEIK